MIAPAPAPAVSFVLPVYNVEAYLRKCLGSILSQTYPDFEVVIVDDGSTDNSLIICKQYANRDSRISVHFQENQGQGIARNRGLDAAVGRYVCYVDPDDWVDDRMVEDLVPAMDASGADFASFGIDFITENGTVTHTMAKFGQSQLQGEAILHSAMIDLDVYSSPCNKIYSRTFLVSNDIRFPPLRVYEDVYYSRIMSRHAQHCIFFDRVYYHALVRLESTTRLIDSSRILAAIKVIELERAKLIGPNCSDLLRSLFDAHVLKFMSYMLLQAAFRIQGWSDYKKCHQHAAAVGYQALCRDGVALSRLPLKNKLISKIAMYPLLAWLLVKMLKAMGVTPY